MGSMYTIGHSTRSSGELVELLRSHGIQELERLASERTTAIMCAEAVPWRCHRNILSDVLTVRGWDLAHIISGDDLRTHELTRFAHIEDGNVTYPAEQPALPFD